MLSQETFLPWIILSLGIHITALTFWPLPPSWEATRPGPIAVDLRYNMHPGDNNLQNKMPGPGAPEAKTLLPPATPHPTRKPAPPINRDRPPTTLTPVKKAVPKRKIQKKPSPDSAQKPALDHNEQTEKTQATSSNQPAAVLVDTSMDNQDSATLTTDDMLTSTASLPQTGGAGANNKGYGNGENGGANGGGGDGIIRATPLGYGDNPAMPYPRSARRRGWEGEVQLKVDVSANGRVLAVHIEKSSGYGILDDAALQAVSEWHFRPARINGLSRPDTVIVPVHFRLNAQ